MKVGGNEGMLNFATALVNAKALEVNAPGTLDKMNIDEILDEYADGTGISPRTIRSDEEVAEIRAVRSQAEQEAMARQAAQESAAAMKTLSETQTEGNNALTSITGQRAG